MANGAKWLGRKLNQLTKKVFLTNETSTPLFNYPPALTGVFANSPEADVTSLPMSTVNPQVMSFDVGIPVLQATEIGAGGVAANMPQMNGALQFISQYVVWMQAGGQFTWQQAIVDAGGYNAGAILYSPALGRQLISLVDNNVAAFTPDGINWKLYGASVNDVYAVGDYKYSDQPSNHTSGTGTWLVCDGQSYSVLQYPSLFALIGYRYGGSGSTFNVPNLTDKVLAMASPTHAAGTVSGANSVTLPLVAHTHSATSAGNSTATNTITKSASTIVTIIDNGHGHSINGTQSQGSNPVVSLGSIAGGALNIVNVNTTGITATAATTINVAVDTAVNTTVNTTVAQAGTSGAAISPIQPTVYVKNVFIYA